MRTFFALRLTIYYFRFFPVNSYQTLIAGKQVIGTDYAWMSLTENHRLRSLIPFLYDGIISLEFIHFTLYCF